MFSFVGVKKPISDFTGGAASASAADEDDDDDDDIDLFGSDEEAVCSCDVLLFVYGVCPSFLFLLSAIVCTFQDAAAEKLKAERAAEYTAKKNKSITTNTQATSCDLYTLHMFCLFLCQNLEL